MSEYELHEYLYKLADDLHQENKSRLNSLMRATRSQGEYNYKREKETENPRYYENIFLADPPDNRETHYANHRNPKFGPARYDLRTYDVESPVSVDLDKPTFYRKCLLEALPEAIRDEIKEHILADLSSDVLGCLLNREDDKDCIVISCRGFLEDGVCDVLQKDLVFEKEHPHYESLNNVWSTAVPTKYKVSSNSPFIRCGGLNIKLPTNTSPVKIATKRDFGAVYKQAYVKGELGLDINYEFLKIIKEARRREK